MGPAMDAITHLLVGRLLAEAVGGAGAPALAWLAVVFAVLPDLDTLTWAFPRLRRYVQHRGLTHTVPFGLALSLAAGGLFAAVGWSSFLAAAGIAFAGFLSHVLLDVLNWGAPVLWPLRHERFEWTVHGGFTWSALLSALGLVAMTATATWAPALSGPLAAVLAGAGAAYLGLRATMKLLVARRHPGARLLPTGNPLVWRVIERAPGDAVGA